MNEIIRVRFIVLFLVAVSKVHSFSVIGDNNLYNVGASVTASTTRSLEITTSHQKHQGFLVLRKRCNEPNRSLNVSLRMKAWDPFDIVQEISSKFTSWSTTGERPMGTNKRLFYQSLKEPYALNEVSNDCSTLLNKMIAEKILCSDDLKMISLTTKRVVKDTNPAAGGEEVPTLSLDNPGLSSTFLRVAPGTWKVVYAPHIATAAKLLGGKFEVQYNLYANSTIISHARYEFPIVESGYLSVSGTYGSVDNLVCRVDFDRAWITPITTMGGGMNDSR